MSLKLIVKKDANISNLDLLADQFKSDNAPGDRIRSFRKHARLTQRQLAAMCDPTMDFTAVGRIEHNKGYTSSTLNRLATALNCDVADFFLPVELLMWKGLPDDMRQEITTMIRRYYQATQAARTEQKNE